MDRFLRSLLFVGSSALAAAVLALAVRESITWLLGLVMICFGVSSALGAIDPGRVSVPGAP